MAGPGATMRVNGFTGGRLPPKSQIRQIRFRMNSFDAENHEGGGFGIDIITKPGMDGWKGMTQLRLPRRVAERAQRVRADARRPSSTAASGFNADGPIVKGKTSIAFNLDGNDSYDSKTINAPTPDGPSRAAACATRRIGCSDRVRVDHSLSEEPADARSSSSATTNKRDNLGVGDFDLPSRAYTSGTASNAAAHRAERADRAEGRARAAGALSSRARDADVVELADPAVIVQERSRPAAPGRTATGSKTLEVADNIDFRRQEARVPRRPARASSTGTTAAT